MDTRRIFCRWFWTSTPSSHMEFRCRRTILYFLSCFIFFAQLLTFPKIYLPIFSCKFNFEIWSRDPIMTSSVMWPKFLKFQKCSKDLCIIYRWKEEQKCNKMSTKPILYLIPFKSYDDFSENQSESSISHVTHISPPK